MRLIACLIQEMKLSFKTKFATCAAFSLILLSALLSSADCAEKSTLIRFPQQPIGHYGLVRVAKNPSDDVVLRGNKWAAGVVSVPDGCAINLTLNYQGSQSTNFIRTLPAKILRGLTCRDLEIDDRAVGDLCSQKGLVQLNLQGVDLSDQGIKQISSLKELRKLSLSDTLVTPKGLAVLRDLPFLENLNLSRLPLGERVDEPLQPLKNLYSLDLTGTQLTDRAVINLPAFPHLRTLILRRNNLTDKCIDSLLRFKKMQNLDFTDTRVTGEGLKRLKGLPRLQMIIIRTASLKFNDKSQLKKLIPGILIEEGSHEKVVPREIFAPLH